MKLTKEQQEIISKTPEQYGNLLISAFAGTGKTFTLQKYAEERPVEKILYCAFNKAIQMEADRKMPMNVSARTTHSLAYQACAKEYRNNGQLRSNVPLWSIAKLLETNIVIANFTLSVVKKFIASPDEKITKNHLTVEIHSYYQGMENIPPFVDMATEVWESMKSHKPRTLPMTHDGYLKLYHLSGPELRYDYILLDEAQDTTPCVWDIIKNQHCRKIVVGDPHQAIYGWRGAIDALDLIDNAEKLYLSKSFRFGQDIADLATTLLMRFKGETKRIDGSEHINTQIITGQRPAERVMVCRGNMHVFRASAAECQYGNNSLGFIGGDHTNYRFGSIMDAYHVLEGNPELAKDPVIKSFKDFEELSEYARKTCNLEIEAACLLAEEYGSRIPHIIRDVKQRDVGWKYGTLSFATGHKSKGMEFPVVEIGPDFTSMLDAHEKNPEIGIINADEINLLYVAITRATERLHISQKLVNFIKNGTIQAIQPDPVEA